MNLKRQTSALTEVDVLAIRSLNNRLMYVERAFILPEGLPGEAWYKHVIDSPSINDAYSGSAFPGVADALAIGDWRQAQRQLDAVCHCITRATKTMLPVIPY